MSANKMTTTECQETYVWKAQASESADVDHPQAINVPRELIESYWDDFSEDELDWIDGRLNRIYLALVDKRGLSRDEAAHELRRFCQEQICYMTQA